MANNGKLSEENVRKILKGYQETHTCFFTRLYDSTTARGAYVPPQVADFLGVVNGVPYAIEVKSSEKHSSMLSVTKGYIRSSQIVGGRVFLRAGGRGLFIFHGLAEDLYEVWDTKNIIDWVLGHQKLQEIDRLLLTKGKKSLETKLIKEVL